jgi:hypothetical protein
LVEIDFNVVTTERPVGSTLYIVNYPLASMFENFQLFFNEKEIENANSHYHYKSLFQTALLSVEDEKNSVLAAGGYAPLTSVNGHTIPEGPYEKQVIGPIFSDVCAQAKFIPPQVSIRIRFTRASNTFLLRSGADVDGAKVEITKFMLHVPRVRVDDNIMRAHVLGLENVDYKFPLVKQIVTTFTIPAGSQTFTRDNIFQNIKPKYCIMGFVPNPSYAGEHDSNPLYFRHYNLTYNCASMDVWLVSRS